MQLGKEFAARGARAASKKDAVAAADDGFAALEALFLKHSAAVDDLVGVARQLRRLPLVDPFLPTVPHLMLRELYDFRLISVCQHGLKDGVLQ